MKIRKMKRRFYINRKSYTKAYVMKFIEVGATLYPLNDRIIFKIAVQPNGSHALVINYTDSNKENVLVGDVTNHKTLPFETQVETVLRGRIKTVSI